jgi:predicted transcriptional regulator
MVMNANILLKSKQAGILIALRDTTQAWYVSSLAKAAGTTYVHACNFINVCEELGVVNCEKHGKLKVVKLTEKGAKITEMLYGINSLITQTAAPPAAPSVPPQQPQAPPKEKEQPEKKQS